jgi:hypothetical protein
MTCRPGFHPWACARRGAGRRASPLAESRFSGPRTLCRGCSHPRRTPEKMSCRRFTTRMSEEPSKSPFPPSTSSAAWGAMWACPAIRQLGVAGPACSWCAVYLRGGVPGAPTCDLRPARGATTRQRVSLAPRFHGTQNMRQVLMAGRACLSLRSMRGAGGLPGCLQPWSQVGWGLQVYACDPGRRACAVGRRGVPPCNVTVPNGC